MAYRGSFSFGSGLTPVVRNLIIANVIIYFVDEMFTGRMLRQYMAFVPSRVLVEPWTLVTYMFAHGGFMHLLFNMLGLFFFGPAIEGRLGSRDFVWFYFVCGLGGAALSFLLAFGSPIIGASAAVYGVMLAFAMNWPDAPIYIYGILPVPAKYLVGFMAFMSLFSMMGSGGSNIAHAAHLGGFAAAFVYLRFTGPGGAFGGLRRMMNKRKMKVVSVEPRDGGSGARPARPAAASPGPTTRRRGDTAEEEQLLNELDRVLEKISTQGMSSLTPQERKLLDEVSRRYRTS